MSKLFGISTTATLATCTSLLNVHWDMSRESHVLFAEHWAVIIPPGRKPPSSKEQGSSACELIGVSGNRKAVGHADQNKSVGEEEGNYLRVDTDNNTAYTLNLRDSLSTMLMNTLSDALSTSFLSVSLLIESVKLFIVSTVSVKLKSKHASVAPTSNMTSASDVILMLEFPKCEPTLQSVKNICALAIIIIALCEVYFCRVKFNRNYLFSYYHVTISTILWKLENNDTVDLANSIHMTLHITKLWATECIYVL